MVRDVVLLRVEGREEEARPPYFLAQSKVKVGLPPNFLKLKGPKMIKVVSTFPFKKKTMTLLLISRKVKSFNSIKSIFSL